MCPPTLQSEMPRNVLNHTARYVTSSHKQKIPLQELTRHYQQQGQPTIHNPVRLDIYSIRMPRTKTNSCAP